MDDTAPESSVPGTPKKKNRAAKKRQRNDQLKVKAPKNNTVKNSAETTSSEKTLTKTETVPKPELLPPSKPIINPEFTNLGPATSNEGGSKTTTPTKTNNVQKPPNQQKNKSNDTPKKIKSPPKAQKNSPSVPTKEDGKRTENYSQEKNCEDRRHIELQRRKIEEERRKRWYNYFLSKPNDLVTLDRNKVVVLKSVERGRPQAQFVCQVCNYYCDSMSVVATHIHKSTHQRLLQDFNDENTLREMPEMTTDQIAVLNEHLLKVVACNGMTPRDLEIRRTITVIVSELLSTNLPGCSIRLFGSSFHGLGLKSSDVNIDLQVSEGSVPPIMLKEVASLLREAPHFEEVIENFDCEFPFVSFTYKISGEQCSISLNNERAVSLALLLSKYAPLDNRLGQLATLFRLWGSLTETDNAKDGTWPGYAFYLMTIFYLQQCPDPVLPVLNDLMEEKAESDIAKTTKVLSMTVGDIKQKWKTNNKQNLAALWLGLLRFYTVDFNYTEYIVSIDSSALIPRKTRKIFIVDPFLPTRNVARSISCNAVFYFIMGCLMTTCRYFSMPQTKFGPVFGEIFFPATKYPMEHEEILRTHNHINSLLIKLILKLDPFFNQPRVGIQEDIAEVFRLIKQHKFLNIDNIPDVYLERNCVPPRNLYRDMLVSRSNARLIVSTVIPKVLEYNFVGINLTGGMKVPKICGVCQGEGHLKDDCPEEKLPPLEPLPPRTPEAMLVLDDLCVFIFDKWKQSDTDIKMREDICQELQDFIRAAHPTARLELFGSTKNGFGLKGSDMDICLTFEDSKTGEGLDTRGFIEILYKLLRTFKGVHDLLPIATAKVPIVKFSHKATGLDGDISLYNVLAMENSKLLSTYAKIDVRARILGYMMKRFSKVCHIGDASKGSLSSYAYSLLVIYFLQRCDPPVLPVLQELTESDGPPPKHLVEGCNAYFFQDLTKLDSVWKGREPNRQSVGELWLNLLIFYTDDFDLLNNVVCIRCSRVITKFEKLWISKGIAIEDPFDLSHNLGSALTRKMSLYIIKALRKGRNHFGRPVKSPVVKDIEAYYFNVKELTDGEPPNDRGCRFCKSIGHKEKTCPEKKKRARSKKNKKMEGAPKKEVFVRTEQKRKSGDEEEDEEEEEVSDSDDGSSVNSDELQRQTPRHQQKQTFPKIVSSIATGIPSTPPDHLVKPSSSGTEQRIQGPQIPPGFAHQEANSSSVQKFGPFRANTPPNTINYLSKNPKSRRGNKTSSEKLTQRNQTHEPKKTSNSTDQVHIPTIVFSNSKLNAEPIHPVSAMRFPFPHGPELSQPPPGFYAFVPNGQRFPNPIPFSNEHNALGQNPPPHLVSSFFGISNAGNMDFNGPLLPSPSPVPLVGTSGAHQTTSVPPYRHRICRLTGILRPAEQMIWGQAPPSPSFTPTNTADPTVMHNLNTSLSNSQLSNSTDSSISSLLHTTREKL